MSSLRAAIVSTGCLLVGAMGCGGVDTAGALAQANSTNIQRLANLYFSYQTKNEWRGPADEAAFQEFVRTFDAKKLARIGVDPQAVDALFVCERDNQPFKIRYGVRGSAMGSSAPVVFESTGVDGRREVGFLDMTQREVYEQEYELLWSGKAPRAEEPRRP